ncbi:MAG: hypothetical protein NTV86_17730 [Planctomycetota bacterium]|nr:hypothetical protein [Planctomycetota bacterium]
MVVAKLHLLLLHFPIALILAAALADALWLWLRRPVFKESGYWCIVLGALAAVPTVITGYLLLDGMRFAGDAAEIGETHELLGVMAMSLALAAGGIRLVGRNRLARLWAYAYAALIAGSAVRGGFVLPLRIPF